MILLTSILLGCAAEPPAPAPPPPPTVVNIGIEPGSNLNADINGNGAPVMLRIYELTEQSNFNSADFFALFDNDEAVLAATLVRKHQLLLQPGESKSITLNPEQRASSLGFFAAFRQVDNARWRTLASIKPHQTQNLKLRLENNQLTLESQP
ncbi:MAG: type VI secretion system lipoprotein TssJ [Methylomonas sp.]|nr:type VI secretion system lipoprotein TssJ [Methylomonas sp.]